MLVARLRHVRHERLIFLKNGPELLDAQLVVVGHMDVLDLVEREQLLLVAEHLLEEVYYKECPVTRILTLVNHF